MCKEAEARENSATRLRDRYRIYVLNMRAWSDGGEPYTQRHLAVKLFFESFFLKAFFGKKAISISTDNHHLHRPTNPFQLVAGQMAPAGLEIHGSADRLNILTRAIDGSHRCSSNRLGHWQRSDKGSLTNVVNALIHSRGGCLVEENKQLLRRWFEEVWNKGALRQSRRCSMRMASLTACRMSF